MRLLFVTPYLPSPPRFGGERRLDGLIRELARRHDVSILSLVDPAEDSSPRVATALTYCRKVTIVPHSRHVAGGFTKRALQAASLASRSSFERLAYTCPSFAQSLRALLARDSFDLIQFEFAQMAAAFAPPGCATPLVVDEHNVEYDVLRRTASAEGGWGRRAFHAANWRKLRAEELRVWRTFDACALTSDRDRDLVLEDAPRARLGVVPNGVDVGEFAPRIETPVEPDSVLFFGALNYHPNTDGLLHFLREVFPKLKAARPGARLRVIGQKPPAAIARWEDPNVEVTGYVDDVRPHIARAAAIVVPLRIGGGTRLKVLEAMAMGRPIVSTSIGAEGIDVRHGRDVLIADDPDAMVAQLVAALAGGSYGSSIGRAARELVVERYSWRASADRLSDLHAEVVDAKRAA